MKAEGSDLRAAARRKVRQPQAAQNPVARPSPHQPAYEPVDSHERWPFAWSAMLVVGVSLFLWAAVIGGGLALAGLFS